MMCVWAAVEAVGGKGGAAVCGRRMRDKISADAGVIASPRQLRATTWSALSATLLARNQ